MSVSTNAMAVDGRTQNNSHGPRQRACDKCRRRKRRCDGTENCSSCMRSKVPCTYYTATIRQEDDRPSDLLSNAYVDALNLRLERAAVSLQQSTPGHPVLFLNAIRASAKAFSPPHVDDAGFIDIADSFQALSLEGPAVDPGFQGKSSAAMLVKAVVNAKSGREDSSMRFVSSPAPKLTPPWQNRVAALPHNLSFPDESSITSLASLYFSNINPFIPVVHRPTFDECVGQQLHIYDLGFGSILLLVCALGSLYLAEPTLSRQDRETLGWKWYNQVELCGHSLHRLPAPHDIQAYCLAVQFLICTSNPRRAWLIAGFGLRVAEDVGSHRNKTWAQTVTIQDDLEKRAFWTLSFLDTQLSGSLGRSAVLDPVQMDVTLPAECDDEHWHTWGLGSQPQDKPASMAFFNCLINLYRIFHLVLRTLYTIRVNQIRMETTHELPRLAAELDAALEKWFTSLPQHLVWLSDGLDGIFFDQSAVLHCFYYYTRILIYRTFVPGLYRLHEPSPDALGICTQAAGGCISVADIHHRRRPTHPLLFSQNPIFTAAMILIINKWSRTDKPRDSADDFALIHKAVDILQCQRERWSSCEFFV
ncbi:fungal-specific transcription factor domain-containing protein [Mycena vitilis]|nr:fungal-specific transcription factor domain-containing protein [Mycena vitilis]